MRICIIGGGIVGSVSAWALQQRGHQVTVVEKEAQIGSQTTDGNASLLCFDSTFSLFEKVPTFSDLYQAPQISSEWCYYYGKRWWDRARVNLDLQELAQESERVYETMKPSFPDFPVSLPNQVTLYESEEQVTPLPRTLIGSARTWAEQAVQDCQVLANSPMQGYRREGDLIKSISTEEQEIEADVFVMATGVTSPFPRPIPVMPVYGRALIRAMSLPREQWSGQIWDALGLCLIKAPTQFRLVQGAKIHSEKQKAKTQLRQAFPELESMFSWDRELITARPVSPDGLPIVARDPKYRNLYHNYGHGFFGWTLSFISAEILVALIEGKKHPQQEVVSLERF